MIDQDLSPDTDEIPPAPWHLSGSACLTMWRLPEECLPYPGADISYATVAGKALVVSFWASYSGEGTCQYNELAIAVITRGRGLLGPSCTVTHIWVDDEIALEGGRVLWGIPKVSGEFALESSPADRSFGARLTAADQPIAAVGFEANVGLPGQPKLSGFILQPGTGGPQRTRCNARGRVVLGKANWDFPDDGPLAFMREARSLFSCRVMGLQGWFGI